MMDKETVLRGRWRRRSGQQRPVIARISAPRRADGSRDFVCQVDCPDLLDGIKRIFGADERSAVENSKGFIRTIWTYNHITDDVDTPDA